MLTNDKSCHGQFDCLQDSSSALHISATSKKWWKLKLTWIHGMWHLRTKGFWETFKLTISKILKPFGMQKTEPRILAERPKPSPDEEVLNLKPGELVEVKSEQEILATLDKNKKHKGLLFMAGMRNFCGKRFRVFKRLETILLESNMEYRKMKNTVLLEGVMCDGKEFYGCDRSCFHFWREAWLRRVK